MLVFIDDVQQTSNYSGRKATEQLKQHISPNSFKREWAVSFGDKRSLTTH
ncbi:hypothetical protein H6S21_23535 (plasmid) [Escherichia coli]|nr:hypothetical protein H6S21_23535 [Escherichia coli]